MGFIDRENDTLTLNNFTLSLVGASVLTLADSSVLNLAGSGVISVTNGTSSAPSYSFTDDLTSGMFLQTGGSNFLHLAVSGQDIIYFGVSNPSNVTTELLQGTLTIDEAGTLNGPALWIDLNGGGSGLYAPSSGVLGISVNTNTTPVAVASFDSNGILLSDDKQISFNGAEDKFFKFRSADNSFALINGSDFTSITASQGLGLFANTVDGNPPNDYAEGSPTSNWYYPDFIMYTDGKVLLESPSSTTPAHCYINMAFDQGLSAGRHDTIRVTGGLNFQFHGYTAIMELGYISDGSSITGSSIHGTLPLTIDSSTTAFTGSISATAVSIGGGTLESKATGLGVASGTDFTVPTDQNLNIGADNSSEWAIWHDSVGVALRMTFGGGTHVITLPDAATGIQLINGTLGAPSYSFTSDSQSGFFLSDASVGAVGFVSKGIGIGFFDSESITGRSGVDGTFSLSGLDGSTIDFLVNDGRIQGDGSYDVVWPTIAVASSANSGGITAPNSTDLSLVANGADIVQVKSTGLQMQGSATIHMGSNKITNLSDPASAQDAATKAYVDAAGPSVVASSLQTGLTFSNNNICSYTPSADGLYRVTMYDVTTTADTGGSAFSWVKVAWKDRSGVSQSFQEANVTMLTLGAYSQTTRIFQAASGQTITVSSHLSSTFANPAYDVYASIEKLA